MHTLHGRSLAVATGVKLGNHELKVICTGGDGDGYGIGGNHFVHTMRRNVDLTYIVMDNQIYGLTTGQISPTSVKGMKTKSTPYGNVENPINPIPMAMVGGATYVARGFSGKQKHMVEMIKGAIQHKGFALVDVFSPCVTYNKDNTYQWFNPRVKILEEQGHDPTDFHKAIDRGYQWGDEIPIGLFWKPHRPAVAGRPRTRPAHRRRPARLPQTRHPRRPGASAGQRVAVKRQERNFVSETRFCLVTQMSNVWTRPRLTPLKLVCLGRGPGRRLIASLRNNDRIDGDVRFIYGHGVELRRLSVWRHANLISAEGDRRK